MLYQIKSGCGDPLASGRRKRAAEQPLPGGGQQQVSSRRRQSSTTTTTTSTTPAPPLDLAALVQDIRTQITTYTNLWHMVSRAICSDEYEKPGVDDETCWNGQKRGRLVNWHWLLEHRALIVFSLQTFVSLLGERNCLNCLLPLCHK